MNALAPADTKAMRRAALTGDVVLQLLPPPVRDAMKAFYDSAAAVNIQLFTTVESLGHDLLAHMPVVAGHENDIRAAAMILATDLRTAFAGAGNRDYFRVHLTRQNSASHLADVAPTAALGRMVVMPVGDDTSLHATVRNGLLATTGVDHWLRQLRDRFVLVAEPSVAAERSGREEQNYLGQNTVLSAAELQAHRANLILLQALNQAIADSMQSMAAGIAIKGLLASINRYAAAVNAYREPIKGELSLTAVQDAKTVRQSAIAVETALKTAGANADLSAELRQKLRGTFQQVNKTRVEGAKLGMALDISVMPRLATDGKKITVAKTGATISAGQTKTASVTSLDAFRAAKAEMGKPIQTDQGKAAPHAAQMTGREATPAEARNTAANTFAKSGSDSKIAAGAPIVAEGSQAGVSAAPFAGDKAFPSASVTATPSQTVMPSVATAAQQATPSVVPVANTGPDSSASITKQSDAVFSVVEQPATLTKASNAVAPSAPANPTVSPAQSAALQQSGAAQTPIESTIAQQPAPIQPQAASAPAAKTSPSVQPNEPQNRTPDSAPAQPPVVPQAKVADPVVSPPPAEPASRTPDPVAAPPSGEPQNKAPEPAPVQPPVEPKDKAPAPTPKVEPKEEPKDKLPDPVPSQPPVEPKDKAPEPVESPPIVREFKICGETCNGERGCCTPGATGTPEAAKNMFGDLEDPDEWRAKRAAAKAAKAGAQPAPL